MIMRRYVAFLRGINVGGRKIIKMEELNRIFNTAGYTGVRTLIQSGNVVFNAQADDIPLLKQEVEKLLSGDLGFDVGVFLVPFDDLVKMFESKPFSHPQSNKKVKYYVSFLSGKVPEGMKIPLFSDKKDLEVFRIEGNAVFILSHEVDGRFGFPNNFVEERTGLSATTRNWNTIEKLVKS